MIPVATRWLAVMLALAATPLPGPRDPEAASRQGSLRSTLEDVPVTVVREHRYRMSAGIRPLLLFWINKDNVGGARVVWRAGEGGVREHELVIGSDPARAPRRVNRWGFVRERTDGRSADVVGLMTESDDQSLDEAKTKVGEQAARGPVYKLIRSRVTPDSSRSETRAVRATSEWSYRDVDKVMAALDGAAGTPRVREMPVPAGSRPGFLLVLVDLLHESVGVARQGGDKPRLLRGRVVPYVFNNTPYTLTLVSTTLLPRERIDGRDYTRLLRHEFETLNHVARSRERFVLTCAVDGPLAEVPVQISYQPKWWFRAELVLDERETF